MKLSEISSTNENQIEQISNFKKIEVVSTVNTEVTENPKSKNKKKKIVMGGLATVGTVVALVILGKKGKFGNKVKKISDSSKGGKVTKPDGTKQESAKLSDNKSELIKPDETDNQQIAKKNFFTKECIEQNPVKPKIKRHFFVKQKENNITTIDFNSEQAKVCEQKIENINSEEFVNIADLVKPYNQPVELNILNSQSKIELPKTVKSTVSITKDDMLNSIYQEQNAVKLDEKPVELGLLNSQSKIELPQVNNSVTPITKDDMLNSIYQEQTPVKLDKKPVELGLLNSKSKIELNKPVPESLENIFKTPELQPLENYLPKDELTQLGLSKEKLPKPELKEIKPEVKEPAKTQEIKPIVETKAEILPEKTVELTEGQKWYNELEQHLDGRIYYEFKENISPVRTEIGAVIEDLGKPNFFQRVKNFFVKPAPKTKVEELTTKEVLKSRIKLLSKEPEFLMNEWIKAFDSAERKALKIEHINGDIVYKNSKNLPIMNIERDKTIRIQEFDGRYRPTKILIKKDNKIDIIENEYLKDGGYISRTIRNSKREIQIHNDRGNVLKSIHELSNGKFEVIETTVNHRYKYTVDKDGNIIKSKRSIGRLDR